MIIITGLPCSGTSSVIKIMKYGGLNTLTFNEIIKNRRVKEIKEIKNKIEEIINADDYDCIEIPSFFLSKIKGEHTVIFIERHLKEVLNLIRKELKREPHISSFGFHAKFIKRILKNRIKNIIFFNFNNFVKNPIYELNKIKDLIPNYKEKEILEKINKKHILTGV